jgi:lysophosphatidylcholine acyltransferase/lyso-PAF acetyltransferase
MESQPNNNNNNANSTTTTTTKRSPEDEALIRETAGAMLEIQKEGLREKMEELRPGGTRRQSQSLQQRVNPFTHTDRIDSWEIIKMMFGVIVVPLRLMGFFFCFLCMVFFLSIACIGADMSKPLNWWRFNLIQKPTIIIFGRGALFCLGLVRIHIKGKPGPNARMVVVAPHSTFMDGFLISYVIPASSSVAKAEVTKTPLMGSVIKAVQSVLVDRNTKAGKKGAAEAIINRIQSTQPWRHLYIFPEGTCTNRKALITFKPGAFMAGMPVQPVLLRWPFSNFDPTWTSGGPNRTYLIFRLLCQIKTTVYVEFMDVYHPSNEEREDAVLYAANVRAKMAEALGVPTTQHSYEDSFLSQAAKKKKLDPALALPYEFSQLAKLHSVTYEDSRKLLERFAEQKKKNKHTIEGAFSSVDEASYQSRLSLPEFAEMLGLPMSEPVAELFAFFDTAGDGYVDFTSFIVGITFLSQNTSIEDAARIVWKAVDQKETGTVSMKKLRRVLDMVFVRSDKNGGKLPLFRELEKTGHDISFDEFLLALKKYPEYIPIALNIASLPLEERPQNRLSLTSATLKKNEREILLNNNRSVTSPGLLPSPIKERHKSYMAKDQVEDVASEQKLA